MSLLLSNCSWLGSGDNPPRQTLATYAALWTNEMTRQLLFVQPLQPSALLGIYMTHFMMHTNVFKSAMEGISAQMHILFDDDRLQDEAFALLQEFGSMLQVDVMDMLNRSNNRSDSFDTYVRELIRLRSISETRLEALKQESDTISDERRDARRQAGDIQRELNIAIREENFSNAGSLQERLIEAETILAEVEAREDKQRSIIRLFEDLLDVSQDRLTALNSNRDAFLAGIKVIDVPGVDDLGLIENGTYRDRRNSGFDRSLIDPNAN